MPETFATSLRRIANIALADFRFRFRRTTALATLLVVAAVGYLIVPDTSTGRTLMQINGARVVYTSAAVALGTAALCGVLISLFGYYIVSNAFRRDILARTGFIIAASPVKNGEYIAGKFCGSVAYLSAVMLTSVASAMVMFLIRGEGPLEPGTFLITYGWLILPGIFFSAAVALFFESVPLLAGRFGDVLFFFIWAATLSVPAALLDKTPEGFTYTPPPVWISTIDVVGLGQLITLTITQFKTPSMSIGQSVFDPALPPVPFPGFEWSGPLLFNRFYTLTLPILLLAASRWAFHRFDPSRVKVSVRHSRRNILSWVNGLLKPVTRALQPLATPGRSTGTLAGAVRADVAATLMLSPVSAVAMAIFALLAIVFGVEDIQGMLPLLILATVMTVADTATRDTAAGMMSLLHTAPRLKMQYLSWKFLSAIVVVAGFTVIPMIKLLFGAPSSGLALLIGSLFIAGCAVGFGVMARTAKLFLAFFLMLLYISLNAKTDAIFDFAGFNGSSTPEVQAGYAALTVIVLAAAQVRYTMGLRK